MYESDRRATRRLGVSDERGISGEKSTTLSLATRLYDQSKEDIELTIFPLGLNLHQHLLLTHDLDDLSNITSRFLKNL